MRFWWFLHRESLTSSEKTLARNAYADCLRYLDDEIGRLIDALMARGRLERTIIVITADHGEHFGEHDLWLHGNSLYQPLVHVPLMVIAPGQVPADHRIAAPVSTADLPATCLDLLGIAEHGIPGRSLAAVWSGAELEPRAVISEVLTPPITPPCQGASPIFRGSMRSVRLGDLKYIRNEDGGEELFDIAADPGELTNLASLPERHDDLHRMRAALEQAL
jgi:arylsulfatase A-like enzyme